jgi:fatty acid desaturase
LDQKAFIASLDDETRLALTARTDGPGLLRLATQWGLIALFGWLIASGAPGWQFLLLPQGLLIVFQFTLLHETVHATPFASQWLNALAGRAASLAVLVPRDWFHYFHLAHHRHTQDPDHDPELEAEKPATLAAWAIHVSGIPVWKSLVSTLVSLSLGRCDHAYVPARARARVVADARLMLAVCAALAAGSLWLRSDLLVWTWIVPALIGQPFLRLYLLAEHGRCPQVANMFENSRTTFTTAIMRWLAWNMPYHAEHHAWPMVPFHRLPRLHALASRHLKVTENGYARFTAGYVAALSRPLETGTHGPRK